MTPEAWVFHDNDYGGEVSQDCLIESLEWLNSLTIVATMSYQPCECPP